MDNISIQIKRKLASFLLFYRHIFSFSVLVAIALSIMGLSIDFIRPGTPTQVPNIQYFIMNLSTGLPTYIFIGALGLTHYVQKNQYYYYRNQGCTIRFLIIASWAVNCFIGGLLLILSNIAGRYG